MIPLLALRAGANTARSRLVEAALAAAIARTTEKLTAPGTQSTIGAAPAVPLVATIRTGS